MFTGLIERVGTLKDRARRSDGATLTVEHPPWDSPLVDGESVAVQGACLTVTSQAAGHFTCDVLEETLRRCNLAHKRAGDRLNLERALRMGDRIGGHWVTGHVDGMGFVSEIRRAGPDWVLSVACDPDLLMGIVMKGSIACEGISLTVSALFADRFEVNIIPYTWEHTSLRDVIVGGEINIETDLLGKHVRRCLDGGITGSDGVTVESLQRAGFVRSASGFDPS